MIRFKQYLINNDLLLSQYLFNELKQLGFSEKRLTKYASHIDTDYYEIFLPIAAEIQRIREQIPASVWQQYNSIFDSNKLTEVKLLKEQQSKLRVVWRCLLKLMKEKNDNQEEAASPT